MDYQSELNIKLNDQVNGLLKEMPSFAGKFFRHQKSKGLSDRTRVQYAYDMKRFFDWLKGTPGFKDLNYKTCTASDVLDKLTIDDIHDYAKTFETHMVKIKKGKNKGKMQEVEVSPALRARRLSSLRSFYKYYFKIKEIDNDLSNIIDIPEVKVKRKKPMDKDQVSKLLEVVKNVEGLSPKSAALKKKTMNRDYAILMLLFGTGIRVSELVGLDISDIDFYDASFYVTRKGGDLDIVYFGQEVEDALFDYIDSDRDVLLGENSEENALFISLRHQRMGVRSVQEMIEDCAKKAGLGGKITPHALRRTFGTNLYEETGDIYLVADALHHSSVETTKKHYAEMSKAHKRIAAEKSSTLFKKYF